MPRKRIIAKQRRRPPELDAPTRRLLGRGQDFHGRFRHPVSRTLDADRVRELWDALRDDFLAEWVEAHPGHRPWAWWTFDAPPDRRRRTDGQPHPHDHADYHAPKALTHGVPRNWSRPDDGRAAYESERDYLARHDLLYEGEAERAAEMGEAADHFNLKIDGRTDEELGAAAPARVGARDDEI